MSCTLAIDNDGKSRCIEMHSAHPKHFPVIGNQERWIERRVGPVITRVVKGRAILRRLFSFLSAIHRNYTLYSLVIRGTPGIIALRFCSDIRRTITQLCVLRRSQFIEINPHFVSVDVLFRCVTNLFFYFILIYEI